MVSITVSSFERLDIDYILILLSIKTWAVWFIFPSGQFQVYLWMFQCGNTVLLTNRFFDVAKFTTLIPLLLLTSRELPFPTVSLKISSLPTFTLKSSTNCSWDTLGTDQIRAPDLTQAILCTSLLFSVGACTFKTIISHQRLHSFI
jgi:hypothetical protein